MDSKVIFLCLICHMQGRKCKLKKYDVTLKVTFLWANPRKSKEHSKISLKLAEVMNYFWTRLSMAFQIWLLMSVCVEY